MENGKFQDLVLGHLVKLTQDLTQTKIEINERLDRVDARLDRVDDRLDRVESAVIRIENEHGEKIKALFDAREVQIDFNREQIKFNQEQKEFNREQIKFNQEQKEFNRRIEKKIDFIAEKVESLDREFDNKIRRIK